MNPLFDYLLKSVLWLCSFYVVYHFLLRKETFCKFNRFFLLTGIFASLIMPLIVVYHTIYTTVSVEDPLPVIATIPAIQAEPTMSFREVIQNTAILLYGVCLAYFIIRTAINLTPILKEIRKHQGNDALIHSRTFSSPFSFGKYIFIPESLSEQERELILAHEYTHTNELHYLDLWVTKAVCILQFFNPIAWLYAKAVQENCEFIADHQTFRNTTLKDEYLQLLIKYSVGHHLNPIALHFSFPLIFKRIKIMKQKQSSKLASLKSLMVVPLAGLIMVGFAQTKIVETKTVVKQQKASQPAASKTKVKPSTTQSESPSQQTDSQKATNQKGNETQQAGQDKKGANSVDEVVVVGYGAPETNDQQTSKRSDEVFTVVEELPKFADGPVQAFLAKNIRYPVEAQKNNIQGRVICQFIVETDGSISSVQVIRSIDPLLDAEACRVLYTMPKWIPGKQRGQIVRVKYTLPITFKLNK
ncbi:M56 family metallopeptidase [Paludibacter jiangxiensis]|uniref:TonB family C-terminal domain-containing protein n=1 Tax=Paludibacter jiangxiensis TaxID=681398 RepID=A0A170Z956_9BACT|nr:M56 family metallopeptidase [Paludibacter jiangxiensis]GAT62438.1 TonB family C-terminal domain-containing protein [Paludibacter jiangxiensis]